MKSDPIVLGSLDDGAVVDENKFKTLVAIARDKSTIGDNPIELQVIPPILPVTVVQVYPHPTTTECVGSF